MMKDSRTSSAGSDNEFKKWTWIIGNAENIQEARGELKMSEEEFKSWVERTSIDELKRELLRKEPSLEEFGGKA